MEDVCVILAQVYANENILFSLATSAEKDKIWTH